MRLVVVLDFDSDDDREEWLREHEGGRCSDLAPWSSARLVATSHHWCDRTTVEQTPGWGHCIVRCVVCHRPGIRTWHGGDKNRPVVAWSDEIQGVGP